MPPEEFIQFLGKRRYWLGLFFLSYFIGFMLTMLDMHGKPELIAQLIAFPVGIMFAVISIVTLPGQLFLHIDPFARSIGSQSPSYPSLFILLGLLLLIPYLLTLIHPAKLNRIMRLTLLALTTAISLFAMRGCLMSSWTGLMF